MSGDLLLDHLLGIGVGLVREFSLQPVLDPLGEELGVFLNLIRIALILLHVKYLNGLSL
jgi:hypothetical protein